MKTLTVFMLLSLVIAVLLGCSKPSDVGSQDPTYTHDLVFQVSTDEPVNAYVLQSSLDQNVWADVDSMKPSQLASDGTGSFPIAKCITNEIFYRIVPVYPYGRGIPSNITRHIKSQ